MRLALPIIPPILTIALVATSAAAGETLPKPVGPWFSGDHKQCGACHIPGENSPLAETCLGCHGDVSPASFEGDFVSGHVMAREMYSPRLPQGGKRVLEQLDCLSCHNPHGGSGDSTVLRDRQVPATLANTRVDVVSRSCIGCHEEMGRFGAMARTYSRHPIGVTAAVVHESHLPVLPLADVQGTADLSDDVVACTTCHYVHNGPNEYLLRWDRTLESRVCGQCHVQGRDRDVLPDPDRLARLGSGSRIAPILDIPPSRSQ